MTDGLRLDLHVHSERSPDSRLTLDAIVRQLPFAGLRGFALTDHNSVAGHREIPRVRDAFPGTLILPGVEVSTQEGHLLAYGVREAPPPHRPLLDTVGWVRDHGGEPVLAHPFRWAHGVGRRVAESAPVTGIEVRNGHSSEVTNYRAEVVAARRGLATTGGSDGHELADLGRSFTEFPVSGEASEDDLLESIRRRQVAPGGQSLRLAGRLRLGLRTGALLVARGFRPI